MYLDLIVDCGYYKFPKNHLEKQLLFFLGWFWGKFLIGLYRFAISTSSYSSANFFIAVKNSYRILQIGDFQGGHPCILETRKICKTAYASKNQVLNSTWEACIRYSIIHAFSLT